MPLHDVNYDETRLRPRTGLGRVPLLDEPVDNGPLIIHQEALTDEFTPYEDVTNAGTSPTIYTTGPVAQDTLPVYNPTTGAFDCVTNNCAGGGVPATSFQSNNGTSTSSPAAVAVSVTPLPAAPKPINWLLLLAAGGLAVVLLRSNETDLRGLPEPAPLAQDLGRPPRKKPTKPKHLDKLTIS